MNKFKLIETEKKERLINAAFNEFGELDFDKASTNRIVKSANVSRGLLYHYFENKQELYDSLFNFAFEETLETLETNLNWDETDVLKRITNIVLIKLEVTKQYPGMLKFVTKVTENMSYEEIRKLSEKHAPGLHEDVYTKNIDYSRFRDDLDIKHVMNIIIWTIEKYSETIQKENTKKGISFDLELAAKEINAYIDIFRKTFYK